jgi:hypothetical protein
MTFETTRETTTLLEKQENELNNDKITKEQALARKWKSDLCGMVFPMEPDRAENQPVAELSDSISES